MSEEIKESFSSQGTQWISGKQQSATYKPQLPSSEFDWESRTLSSNWESSISLIYCNNGQFFSLLGHVNYLKYVLLFGVRKYVETHSRSLSTVIFSKRRKISTFWSDLCVLGNSYLQSPLGTQNYFIFVGFGIREKCVLEYSPWYSPWCCKTVEYSKTHIHECVWKCILSGRTWFNQSSFATSR